MLLSSSQPAPFVLVTLRARGLSLAATGIHLSSLTGTSFLPFCSQQPLEWGMVSIVGFAEFYFLLFASLLFSPADLRTLGNRKLVLPTSASAVSSPQGHWRYVC